MVPKCFRLSIVTDQEGIDQINAIREKTKYSDRHIELFISCWQTANNTDELPSVEEFIAYANNLYGSIASNIKEYENVSDETIEKLISIKDNALRKDNFLIAPNGEYTFHDELSWLESQSEEVRELYNLSNEKDNFQLQNLDKSKIDSDKPFASDEHEGNETLKIYLKGQSERGYFELVKDKGNFQYSIYFKPAKKDSSSNEKKIEPLTEKERNTLFKALYAVIPDGAIVSTWGTLSKEDAEKIKHIDKFLKNNGDKTALTRIGGRTVGIKGESYKVNIPVYLKNTKLDNVLEKIYNILQHSEIYAEIQDIREKAIKDGDIVLNEDGSFAYAKAPNGERSNLNEQQWLQVRTKAFKEWFGDWEKVTFDEQNKPIAPKDSSKIIDENGEPLVVYHGTKNKFSTFDINFFKSNTDDGQRGRGFYFSETDDNSNQYNRDSGNKSKLLFINLRNPFYSGQHSSLTINEAIRRGGIVDEFNRGNGEEVEELKQYDGVVYSIYVDNEYIEYYEIVVKNPNDIKSADLNDGLFSSTDDDTYHDEASYDDSKPVSLKNKAISSELKAIKTNKWNLPKEIQERVAKKLQDYKDRKTGELQNVNTERYFGSNNQTTASEILKHIATNSTDPSIQKLATYVLKHIGIYGDVIVNKTDETNGPKGEYYYATNSIAIHASSLVGENASKALNNMEQTIIHEIIHAITVNTIENNAEARKEVLTIFKEFTELQDQYGIKLGYASKNVHEFVAEFLSNIAFREALMALPSNNETKLTIGQRILNFIKRIIGIKPQNTFFNNANTAILKLLDISNEFGYTNSFKENIVFEDNNVNIIGTKSVQAREGSINTIDVPMFQKIDSAASMLRFLPNGEPRAFFPTTLESTPNIFIANHSFEEAIISFKQIDRYYNAINDIVKYNKIAHMMLGASDIRQLAEFDQNLHIDYNYKGRSIVFSIKKTDNGFVVEKDGSQYNVSDENGEAAKIIENTLNELYIERQLLDQELKKYNVTDFNNSCFIEFKNPYIYTTNATMTKEQAISMLDKLNYSTDNDAVAITYNSAETGDNTTVIKTLNNNTVISASNKVSIAQNDITNDIPTAVKNILFEVNGTYDFNLSDENGMHIVLNDTRFHLFGARYALMIAKKDLMSFITKKSPELAKLITISDNGYIYLNKPNSDKSKVSPIDKIKKIFNNVLSNGIKIKTGTFVDMSKNTKFDLVSKNIQLQQGINGEFVLSYDNELSSKDIVQGSIFSAVLGLQRRNKTSFDNFIELIKISYEKEYNELLNQYESFSEDFANANIAAYVISDYFVNIKKINDANLHNAITTITNIIRNDIIKSLYNDKVVYQKLSKNTNLSELLDLIKNADNTPVINNAEQYNIITNEEKIVKDRNFLKEIFYQYIDTMDSVLSSKQIDDRRKEIDDFVNSLTDEELEDYINASTNEFALLYQLSKRRKEEIKNGLEKASLKRLREIYVKAKTEDGETVSNEELNSLNRKDLFEKITNYIYPSYNSVFRDYYINQLLLLFDKLDNNDKNNKTIDTVVRWVKNIIVNAEYTEFPPSFFTMMFCIEEVKKLSIDPLNISFKEACDILKNNEKPYDNLHNDPKLKFAYSTTNEAGEVIEVYDFLDDTDEERSQHLAEILFSCDKMSPWCIGEYHLDENGKPKVNPSAVSRMHNYNYVVQRQIAFINGAPFAMHAGSESSQQWWDRRDRGYDSLEKVIKENCRDFILGNPHEDTKLKINGVEVFFKSKNFYRVTDKNTGYNIAIPGDYMYFYTDDIVASNRKVVHTTVKDIVFLNIINLIKDKVDFKDIIFSLDTKTSFTDKNYLSKIDFVNIYKHVFLDLYITTQFFKVDIEYIIRDICINKLFTTDYAKSFTDFSYYYHFLTAVENATREILIGINTDKTGTTPREQFDSFINSLPFENEEELYNAIVEKAIEKHKSLIEKNSDQGPVQTAIDIFNDITNNTNQADNNAIVENNTEPIDDDFIEAYENGEITTEELHTHDGISELEERLELDNDDIAEIESTFEPLIIRDNFDTEEERDDAVQTVVELTSDIDVANYYYKRLVDLNLQKDTEARISKWLNNYLAKQIKKYGYENFSKENISDIFGVDPAGAIEFFQKIIFISENQENIFTYPEEFSHAFWKLFGTVIHDSPTKIKDKFTREYNDLIKAIKDTELYRVTYEEYKDVYTKTMFNRETHRNEVVTDEKLIAEEALGKALSEALVKKATYFADRNFIQKLRDWVLKVVELIVNKLIGKNNFKLATASEEQKKQALKQDLDRIAQNILNGSYETLYLNRVKRRGYKLLTLQDTLKAQEKIDKGNVRNIISKLNRLQYSIGGSLGLRAQGRIYRDKTEPIHDLDCNMPFDKSWPLLLLPELKRKAFIQDAQERIEDNLRTCDAIERTTWFEELKNEFDNISVVNGFSSKGNICVTCMICENPELSKRFKQMTGTYASRLKQFTKKERESILLIDFFATRNRDNEVSTTIIDGITFVDANDIWKRKYSMGRPKDIDDYQHWVPYSREDVNNRDVIYQLNSSQYVSHDNKKYIASMQNDDYVVYEVNSDQNSVFTRVFEGEKNKQKRQSIYLLLNAKNDVLPYERTVGSEIFYVFNPIEDKAYSINLKTLENNALNEEELGRTFQNNNRYKNYISLVSDTQNIVDTTPENGVYIDLTNPNVLYDNNLNTTSSPDNISFKNPFEAIPELKDSDKRNLFIAYLNNDINTIQEIAKTYDDAVKAKINEATSHYAEFIYSINNITLNNKDIKIYVGDNEDLKDIAKTLNTLLKKLSFAKVFMKKIGNNLYATPFEIQHALESLYAENAKNEYYNRVSQFFTAEEAALIQKGLNEKRNSASLTYPYSWFEEHCSETREVNGKEIKVINIENYFKSPEFKALSETEKEAREKEIKIAYMKAVKASYLTVMPLDRTTDATMYASTVVKFLDEQGSIPLDNPNRTNVAEYWTKHDGKSLVDILEAGKRNKVAIIPSISITTLGGTAFEPGVLKYQDLINELKKIIKTDSNPNGILDPALLTIRVDPIIPGMTKVEDIKNVINSLYDLGVRKFVFSIMQTYSYRSDNVNWLEEAYLKETGEHFDWEKWYGYDKEGKINFWAKKGKDEIVDNVYGSALREIIKEKPDIRIESCGHVFPGTVESQCLDPFMVSKVSGIDQLSQRLSLAVSSERVGCQCAGFRSSGLESLRQKPCSSSCLYCYETNGETPFYMFYDQYELFKNENNNTTEGSQTPSPNRLTSIEDQSGENPNTTVVTNAAIIDREITNEEIDSNPDILYVTARSGKVNSLNVESSVGESVEKQKFSITINGVTIDDLPFKLNEEQENALQKLADFVESDKSRITLSGYAGTGKTSIMTIFAKYLQQKYNDRRSIFTATTNKAAGVLSEKTKPITNEDASTIYSLLKLVVVNNSEHGASYDADNTGVSQLGSAQVGRNSIIIVDECSMIDNELFNTIKNIAERTGSKFIFLGDIAQIPPVEKRGNGIKRIGPIFKDLDTELIQLTKVERTGDNAILKESTAMRGIPDINEDKELPMSDMPKLSGITEFNSKGEGVAYVNSRSEAQRIAAELSKKIQEDSDKFIVIAYTNKTVGEYNTFIRQSLGYTTAIPQAGEPLLMYNNFKLGSSKSAPELYNSSIYTVKNTSATTSQVSVKVKLGYDRNNVAYYDFYYFNAYMLTIEIDNQEYTIPYVDTNPFAANKTAAEREVAQKNLDILARLSNDVDKGEYISNSQKFAIAGSVQSQILFNNVLLDPNRKTSRLKIFSNKGVDFAYAITSDKSQGSTYENTLIVLDDFYLGDFDAVSQTKRVYTAVSRASKTATVLCTNKDLLANPIETGNTIDHIDPANSSIDDSIYGSLSDDDLLANVKAVFEQLKEELKTGRKIFIAKKDFFRLGKNRPNIQKELQEIFNDFEKAVQENEVRLVHRTQNTVISTQSADQLNQALTNLRTSAIKTQFGFDLPLSVLNQFGITEFTEEIDEIDGVLIDAQKISENTASYGVQIDNFGSNDFHNRATEWLKNNSNGIIAYRKYSGQPRSFTKEAVESGWIGNPFSVESRESETVDKFYEWLITGHNFGEQLATDEFRQAIIDKLLSIDDPNILYYKELNRPSHATVLGYLIKHKDLIDGSKDVKSIFEQKNQTLDIHVGTTTYTKDVPQRNPNKAYVFTDNAQAYVTANQQDDSWIEEGYSKGDQVKTGVSDVNGTNQAGIRASSTNSYGARNINKNTFGLVVKKYQQKIGQDTFLSTEGLFNDTPEDIELFKTLNNDMFKRLEESGLKDIEFPSTIAMGRASLPESFAIWLKNELETRYGLIYEIKQNPKDNYNNGFGLVFQQKNISKDKTVNQANRQRKQLENKPYHFYSVEHAYQTLKSGVFDTKVYNSYSEEFDSKIEPKHAGKIGTKTDNNWNVDLMTFLIGAKLANNPELYNAIRLRGGIDYLNKCKHIVNGNDKFWEDGEGNAGMFMKCLKTAYESLANEINSFKPNDELLLPHYSLHSGGALGSDMYFQFVAHLYGMSDNPKSDGSGIFAYQLGRTNNTATANVYMPLSIKEDAVKMLENIMTKSSYENTSENVKNLLIRDYAQAYYSDAVFAIINDFDFTKSRIRQNTVNGGTGYAVAFAIKMNKPVYVFHQGEEKWYVYNRETQEFDEYKNEETDNIPVLTQKFAGIGTRELTESGRSAIDKLFEIAGEQERNKKNQHYLDRAKLNEEIDKHQNPTIQTNEEATETISKKDKNINRNEDIFIKVDSNDEEVYVKYPETIDISKKIQNIDTRVALAFRSIFEAIRNNEPGVLYEVSEQAKKEHEDIINKLLDENCVATQDDGVLMPITYHVLLNLLTKEPSLLKNIQKNSSNKINFSLMNQLENALNNSKKVVRIVDRVQELMDAENNVVSSFVENGYDINETVISISREFSFFITNKMNENSNTGFSMDARAAFIENYSLDALWREFLETIKNSYLDFDKAKDLINKRFGSTLDEINVNAAVANRQRKGSLIFGNTKAIYELVKRELASYEPINRSELDDDIVLMEEDGAAKHEEGYHSSPHEESPEKSIEKEFIFLLHMMFGQETDEESGRLIFDEASVNNYGEIIPLDYTTLRNTLLDITSRTLHAKDLFYTLIDKSNQYPWIKTLIAFLSGDQRYLNENINPYAGLDINNEHGRKKIESITLSLQSRFWNSFHKYFVTITEIDSTGKRVVLNRKPAFEAAVNQVTTNIGVGKQLVSKGLKQVYNIYGEFDREAYNYNAEILKHNKGTIKKILETINKIHSDYKNNNVTDDQLDTLESRFKSISNIFASLGIELSVDNLYEMFNKDKLTSLNVALNKIGDIYSPDKSDTKNCLALLNKNKSVYSAFYTQYNTIIERIKDFVPISNDSIATFNLKSEGQKKLFSHIFPNHCLQIVNELQNIDEKSEEEYKERFEYNYLSNWLMFFGKEIKNKVPFGFTNSLLYHLYNNKGARSAFNIEMCTNIDGIAYNKQKEIPSANLILDQFFNDTFGSRDLEMKRYVGPTFSDTSIEYFFSAPYYSYINENGFNVSNNDNGIAWLIEIFRQELLRYNMAKVRFERAKEDILAGRSVRFKKIKGLDVDYKEVKDENGKVIDLEIVKANGMSFVYFSFSDQSDTDVFNKFANDGLMYKGADFYRAAMNDIIKCIENEFDKYISRLENWGMNTSDKSHYKVSTKERENLINSIIKQLSEKQFTIGEEFKNRLIKEVYKYDVYTLKERLSDLLKTTFGADNNDIIEICNGINTDNIKDLITVNNHKVQLYDALKDYFFNHYLADQNFKQLLIRDAIFFKDDVELQKRIKQSYSPVSTAYNGHFIFNSEGQYQTCNDIIREDEHEFSIELVDVDNYTSRAEKEIVKLINEFEKEGLLDSTTANQILKSLISTNGKDGITPSDAQCYRTLSSWKKVMLASGLADANTIDDIVDYIQNKKSEERLIDAFSNLKITVIKPFVSSINRAFSHFKENSNNDRYDEIQYPTQHKNAEFVLLAIYDKIYHTINDSPQLRALNAFMEKHGIDKAQFTTAIKEGNHGAIDITKCKDEESVRLVLEESTGLTGNLTAREVYFDDETENRTHRRKSQKEMYEYINQTLDNEIVREEGEEEEAYNERRKKEFTNKTNQFDSVHITPFDRWGISVRNPEHLIHHGKSSIGTQIIKIIQEDIPDDAMINIDGEEFTKEEWIRIYQSIFTANVIQEFGKFQTQINDGFKLSEMLKRQLRNTRNFNPDLMRHLEVDENGSFKYPLNDPLLEDEFFSLCASIVRNRITKQLGQTASLVQVSSAFKTDVLGMIFNNTNDNAIFTSEEDFNHASDKPSKQKQHYTVYNNDGTVSEFESYDKYVEFESENAKSIKYMEIAVPMYNQDMIDLFTRPDGSVDELKMQDVLGIYVRLVDENGNLEPEEIASERYKNRVLKKRAKQIEDCKGDVEKINRLKKKFRQIDKMTECLGYRIPTEAKHSMCPCKIKFFLPSQNASCVMTPAEWIAVSDADNDNDKLYMLFYELKPIYAVSIHDKEGLEKYVDKNYKALKKKGIFKAEHEVKEGDSKDVLQEKYEGRINDFVEYFKNNKKEFLVRLEPYEFKIDKEFEGIEDKGEKYVRQIYKNIKRNDGKRRNNNLLLDLMNGILRQNFNTCQILTPGGFPEAKRVANIILALENGLVANDRSFESAEDAINELLNVESSSDVLKMFNLTVDKLGLLNPAIRIEQQLKNMAGKNLIPIYATFRSFRALVENTRLYVFNNSIVINGNRTANFNKLTKCFDFSIQKNSLTQYITNIIANFSGASVDNAKTPLLSLLGQSEETAAISMLMANMGYSLLEIALFMSQPVISEMIRNAQLNNTSFYTELKNEIANVSFGEKVENLAKDLTNTQMAKYIYAYHSNDFSFLNSQEGIDIRNTVLLTLQSLSSISQDFNELNSICRADTQNGSTQKTPSGHLLKQQQIISMNKRTNPNSYSFRINNNPVGQSVKSLKILIKEIDSNLFDKMYPDGVTLYLRNEKTRKLVEHKKCTSITDLQNVLNRFEDEAILYVCPNDIDIKENSIRELFMGDYSNVNKTDDYIRNLKESKSPMAQAFRTFTISLVSKLLKNTTSKLNNGTVELSSFYAELLPNNQSLNEDETDILSDAIVVSAMLSSDLFDIREIEDTDNFILNTRKYFMMYFPEIISAIRHNKVKDGNGNDIKIDNKLIRSLKLENVRNFQPYYKTMPVITINTSEKYDEGISNTLKMSWYELLGNDSIDNENLICITIPLEHGDQIKFTFTRNELGKMLFKWCLQTNGFKDGYRSFIKCFPIKGLDSIERYFDVLKDHDHFIEMAQLDKCEKMIDQIVAHQTYTRKGGLRVIRDLRESQFEALMCYQSINFNTPSQQQNDGSTEFYFLPKEIIYDDVIDLVGIDTSTFSEKRANFHKLLSSLFTKDNNGTLKLDTHYIRFNFNSKLYSKTNPLSVIYKVSYDENSGILKFTKLPNLGLSGSLVEYELFQPYTLGSQDYMNESIYNIDPIIVDVNSSINRGSSRDASFSITYSMLDEQGKDVIEKSANLLGLSEEQAKEIRGYIQEAAEQFVINKINSNNANNEDEFDLDGNRYCRIKM